MSAICAICGSDIVRRQDVRVAGTEVMHAGCARSGRETVGTRRTREVAALRADLTRARELLQRQSAEHMKDLEIGLEREARLRRAVDDALATIEQARLALLDMERQRDRAVSERDLARRAEVTPAPASAESAAADSQSDDSVTRFSLLEFG